MMKRFLWTLKKQVSNAVRMMAANQNASVILIIWVCRILYRKLSAFLPSLFGTSVEKITCVFGTACLSCSIWMLNCSKLVCPKALRSSGAQVPCFFV
uniref:ORF2 protein n=1 Tax=Garlic latent virus E29-6 TaxID=143616 RepID=Q67664_9VIRU|nr:ORF2 [Garlic latent virus E29-6]